MTKKDNKKIIILIALVVVTGAFFFAYKADMSPSTVFANQQIVDNDVYSIFNTVPLVERQYAQKEDLKIKKPWDVTINFLYDGKTATYKLSDNIDGLTKQQQKKRCIYASCPSKSKWLTQRTAEGIPLYLSLCYLFPQLDQLVKSIAKDIDTLPIDATIKFFPNSSNKFKYTTDKNGRQTEVDLLSVRLCEALKTGDACIGLKVPVKTLLPDTTLLAAQKATTLKSYFKTDCKNSTADRQFNIALALSFFNGKIIESGEQISFNQTVGVRTAERGFKNAKILVSGKYIDGIGGGVCQASTTLFNALLLANLKVTMVCQHSARCGYILPGFDAMVNSGSADLVFINDTILPVYIAASCSNGEASVQIFGTPNQYTIRRRSITKQILPFKTRTTVDKEGKYADKITFEDQQLIIQKGIEGIVSEAYLDYYTADKLIFSKLYRKNRYNAIDLQIVTGSKKRQIVSPNTPST